ncbi:putative licABCH operon regulator [Neobacillus rhizosphaerae]|uniref:LicABCH operon regulator n=1 Tax=Neobacillus rhizosphaerae TaxID=2880965 RepID=A0ABM9EN49_9BACI|nr:transcription antiterminator [Neobacillus rhizosphaerae]CAH2714042.1 putative licABCH operon regulator [Neobacillus rhizosphaerae]
MVSKRLATITELLLRSNDYITVDTISKSLAVSNKTIRNDLFLLEDWIKEFQLVLDKKTGVGVAILGEENKKLRVLQEIKEKTHVVESYSPLDRKCIILEKLLTGENKIRIHELSSQLYVSRATIHKDLLEIHQWLKEYKIELIRKTNHGLEIIGKEKNLRKAITSLIRLQKSHLELVGYFQSHKETEEDTFSVSLRSILDIDLPTLKRLVFTKNSLGGFRFSDESLFSLLILIAICIKRISENKNIILSEEFLEELKSDPEFFEVETIFNAVGEEFNITFNQHEIAYLLVHIKGSKTDTSKDQEESQQNESYKIAKQVILCWEKALSIPLCKDKELLSSLTMHLAPAIIRLKHGLTLNNPILEDIQNVYPYTYDVAKQSTYIIKESLNCNVDESEIGYLTLHLVTAIDRAKKPLKTIIVCHSSIGTSQLLVNKLKMEFNQLEIVALKTSTSIFDYDLRGIDLIITTIPLTITNSTRILTISPLLKELDIRLLNSIIKKIYSDKNSLSN